MPSRCDDAHSESPASPCAHPPPVAKTQALHRKPLYSARTLPWRVIRLALEPFAVPLKFLEFSKRFIRLNRCEGESFPGRFQERCIAAQPLASSRS